MHLLDAWDAGMGHGLIPSSRHSTHEQPKGQGWAEDEGQEQGLALRTVLFALRLLLRAYTAQKKS